MKKIEVQSFGDPTVLRLVDAPAPKPGQSEVVIEVQAVGVNPVETYIRAGIYPRLPSLPYCPGGNVAGVVTACGDGVTGWKVGDRVYSGATKSGAYAEYTLCDENLIYSLPPNVSFAEGAALGVPAATAWRALFVRGEMQKDETVLIHGGSGSVGQAAIQFARGRGNTVYATAGTERGCALIEKLGAIPLRHDGEDYAGKIKEVGGVDLIIEMLANKNLSLDLELLRPKGRVVIVGSRGPIEIDPRATMAKESDIRGLALASASIEELQDTHNGIFETLVAETYCPHIAKEFSLSQAADAHELVLQDGNCGKIILIP